MKRCLCGGKMVKIESPDWTEAYCENELSLFNKTPICPLCKEDSFEQRLEAGYFATQVLHEEEV